MTERNSKKNKKCDVYEMSIISSTKTSFTDANIR